MEFLLYFAFFLALIILVNHRRAKTPDAVAARATRAEQDRQIVCPHCGRAGCVTSRLYQAKQGVSGGKATSALLTAGISLAAVGLSKKAWVRRLSCSNCGMTWDVA
jgi:transcription elongation factor Elf1